MNADKPSLSAKNLFVGVAPARYIRCALLLAGFLPAANAGGAGHRHPDFSGTWRLDARGSDFGRLPALVRMVDEIRQTPSSVSIRRVQATENQETASEIVYQLNGAESFRRYPAGESHSKVHWQGEVLVIDSKVEFDGMPMRVEDRWVLAPDGKSLEIDRRFQSRRGAMVQKLLLVKQ